jgi:hypothetical protein
MAFMIAACFFKFPNGWLMFTRALTTVMANFFAKVINNDLHNQILGVWIVFCQIHSHANPALTDSVESFF